MASRAIARRPNIALGHEAIARLQAAVLALYEPRDLPAFRQAVPRAFLGAIPADYFVMSEFTIDRRARRVRMTSCWESREQITPEFAAGMEHALFDHPFTQHTLRHGPTGALMLSDFLPRARLKRTPMYREMLKPSGVEYVLGSVSPGPRGIITLTLTRGPGERPFADRDRQAFELLEPHFALARELVERSAEVKVEQLQPVTHYGFTRRESEIARLLAKGKTNPEISASLDSRVRTVEKHLERIYAKLGVENRTTAALMLASSPGI